MKCVVGIDGGGTKSLLRMVDMKRKVLYETVSGGANLCSIDSDQVKNNLEQMLQNAASQVPDAQIISICLGAAGIVNENHVAFLREALQPYAENIQVVNDAYIAMYANLKEDSGIVLTAGTGSILYGRNQSGKVLRVGGWGHLMGDEGSGYRIGLQALNTIARNYDMQKADSKLLSACLEHFQCADFQSMVSRIYGRPLDKRQIAALASIVDRAAENGDRDAIGILKECAWQLYVMCHILIERLELGTTSFYIVTNGSIIQKCRLVSEEFSLQIRRSYPGARIKTTSQDSAWGAVDIALEHAKEGRSVNGKMEMGGSSSIQL